MRKSIIICIIMSVCGCVSIEPKVQTARSWENHYMTVEEFREGTKDITLDEGTTIWVLSNHSLSRVIKEMRGKTK